MINKILPNKKELIKINPTIVTSTNYSSKLQTMLRAAMIKIYTSSYY